LLETFAGTGSLDAVRSSRVYNTPTDMR
jgi:hypothetical protein